MVAKQRAANQSTYFCHELFSIRSVIPLVSNISASPRGKLGSRIWQQPGIRAECAPKHGESLVSSDHATRWVVGKYRAALINPLFSEQTAQTCDNACSTLRQPTETQG